MFVCKINLTCNALTGAWIVKHMNFVVVGAEDKLGLVRIGNSTDPMCRTMYN